MTDKPRSRHIPKEEVTKLLEESRSRCCLCRVFIDPAQYDPDTLFDSLEKHHIIMFSLGGLHSHENLLLACANCHTQIHKHPEKHPVDELREKKRHWVGMRDVVPAELELPGEGEDALQVIFSVEALNLQYTITAPPQATVGELALFVGESILKPLDEYDGYKPLPPGEIGLALRSDSEAILAPALSLGEIELAPGDALVANVPARRIRVFPPPIFDRRGEGEPAAREPAAEPRLREVASEPERDSEQPVWERRYSFEPEMVFVLAGPFWMGTDRGRLEAARVRWEEWMERDTIPPGHPPGLLDRQVPSDERGVPGLCRGQGIPDAGVLDRSSAACGRDGAPQHHQSDTKSRRAASGASIATSAAATVGRRILSV